MPPRIISIIVPVFNGESTLRQSLLSINAAMDMLKSTHSDIEVEAIVIDDGSVDATASIAMSLDWTVVSLPLNAGVSAARCQGVLCSTGDILVFIDCDALIPPNTLVRILEGFTNQEIGAITCLLDVACPRSGFFSQYKNLYMHYNFSVLPSEVTFLYGTTHAVRRSHFTRYDTNLVLTADTQLGQELHRRGVKILLDKQLLITHLKRHTAWSFVQNNFRVPYEWGTRFFDNAGVREIVRRRAYAHAGMRQLVSLALVPVFVVLAAFGFFSYAGLALALFYIINTSYLLFIKKQRGWVFLGKSVLVLWLDAVVMSAGAAVGMTWGLIEEVLMDKHQIRRVRE